MASTIFRISYGIMFGLMLISCWPVVSANVDQLRSSVNFSYYLGNKFLDFIRWGSDVPPKKIYVDFMKFETMNPSEIFKLFTPVLISYTGYLVCLAFGILFVIIMPLVGMFFCCCRCCGRCGGNVKVMDSSHAKCKRVFYTICLALLNTIMLAGVVLAFINNQLLHESVANKNEDINALKQINKSFAMTDESLRGIVKSVRNNSMIALQNETQVLRGILGTNLDSIQDTFLKEARDKKMFQSIEAIQSAVVKFGNYHDDSRRYEANGKILIDYLEQKSPILLNDLANCPAGIEATCKELRDQAKAGLTLNYDYGNVNLNSPRDLVAKILQFKDGAMDLTKMNDVFNTISTRYRDAVQGDIDDLKKRLGDSQYVKEAQDWLEKWVKRIQSVLTQFSSFYKDESFRSEEIVRFDKIRLYAFIVVCCLILLIVLFYYLGLCFGMCGERPFEDASLCNRGVGANLLMAGVAFTFFFSWLLMLITMSFFMVGGFTQTELCRYATGDFPGGPRILDRYLNNVPQHITGNDMYTVMQNTSVQPFEGLLDGCKDKSIMEAFNLTTQMFDTEEIYRRVIKPWMNDVKQSCSDVTPLDSLAAYKRTLDNLKNIPALKSINVDASIRETAKTVVKISNINQFLMKLEALQNDYPQLKASVNNFRSMVVSTQRSQEAMNAHFIDISTFLMHVNNINDGIGTIEKNMDFSSKMKIEQKAIAAIDVSLEKEVNRVLEAILSSVRCDKLRDSVRVGINAVCVTALYPFNGFWYGLGACLLLFIPTIIFAVKLAGLYRKTEKYCSDYEEPDYMSYQGFYINPGDNIPLERMGSYKMVLGKGQEKGRNNQRDVNQRVNQRYQQLPVYPYDAYE